MDGGDVNSRELLGQATRWIRRQPERLGFDLHTSILRAVQLRRNKQEGYQVVGCGSVEFTDFWNETNPDRERIKFFLDQFSQGMKKCAFVAEHSTLLVRRMNIAPMPESDLVEAIRWNFREHVDCPIEKYTVGYTPLTHYDEKGQLALMAYGISEEAIHQYVKLAKDLGYKLISLEPAATALLAAFHLNRLLTEDRFTICLHMDEETTYFIVMTAHVVLFSRPLTGMSLQSFLEMLQHQGNVEPQAAKTLFQEWIAGKESDLHGAEIATTATHFLRQLVIEVQRSIDAFCIMYGVESVHDLFICGKGVQFPKLKEHMEHSLGMEVHVFDPFLHLPLPAEIETMSVPERSTYAIAVGLSVI